MRVAMYEMLYMDKIPSSVSINEAVELAKRFGIFSIPTLIAFNNGAQTEKRVGVQTAEQLAEMLG